MSNRLANETSPYLLQHKDNPVDWYPWGEEALARARTEDRPILLSVGYSSCHWCHVMEHESFADPETAALMNEHFINVKVDREERPDIDSLYMQAVQQMTGRGGWPMTVFLRPDGTPFYGGTYFPPEPRHGLPSFRQVMLGVMQAYRDRRDEVDGSAEQLRRILKEGLSVNPKPGDIDETLLERAFQVLMSRYDAQHGGFGAAPKFPQPMVIEFLLLYSSRTHDERALSMATETLEAMARGGVYDQLGGGFHRYSVDARWLVPHFEKMLYDNALLARVYLQAFQVTRKEEFRSTAEDILAYVQREMHSQNGAFFSSQDADSEGVEGRFYVWSAEEIDSVLGAADGALFRRYFGVESGGNWEGTNILHTPHSLAEAAERSGVSVERLAAVIRAGRERLYDVRANRIWPSRDDKVLTSWNAMMLHTFADASRILDEARYGEIAASCAEFLLGELRQDGRLLRSWLDGPSRIGGFLEDHALFVDALVALYSTTFEVRWIREASAIADVMIEQFWSPEEELFYDAPADGERLLLRPRDIYDNATPSGTSAATRALLRLTRLTGETRYERIAARVLGSLGDVASRLPQAFGNLLCALDHHLTPPSEVAIVGERGRPDTTALLNTLHAHFLPHTVIASSAPGDEPDTAELVPLLRDRPMRDNLATAYVCQRFACRQPVTTVEELERELSELPRR